MERPHSAETGSPPVSLRSAPVGAWGVLAFGLLVQLAFLHKPFHVDDTVVLHIARQVLANPMHPLTGELDWDGTVRPTFHVTTNPPLLSYYLALWMWLGGEQEWLLHTAMLMWQVLLWWGTVLLARRFGVNPTLTAALVLLNPATIVSPNLMRDVPMVALWTLGTALFLWGSDAEDHPRMGWGALLVGCAALMKYSGLGAIVLLGVYVLLQHRPRQLLWVAAALLPTLVWCVHNLLVHGELHFVATMRRVDISTSLSDRLWGSLAGLGGVWLLWLWAGLACRQMTAITAALVSALVIGGWRWAGWQPRGDVEASFWSGAGAFLLVLSLFRARQVWREQAFLVLWSAWVLFAIGVGAPFAAARHLLPALPPLAVMWCWDEVPARWRRVALHGVLATQAVFGIYAGWCDAQIAEVYRRGANLIVRECGAEAFVGHWGWMYYARRAGLQQVSSNRLPPEGSRVVVPTVGGDAVVPTLLVSRLVYEQSVEVATSARLATLPPTAGFYASVRGAPPFRWLSEGYREQFDLFVVEAEIR
jgi:hypothetical protein